MHVLFRAAAGPSIGFGHLVRCRSLARVLGLVPSMSVRGPQSARAVAAQLGMHVETGGLALLRAARRPDVLVVDDPSAGEAARWVSAARACGIKVLSVHDAGIGATESDIAVDGSIQPGVTRSAIGLAGPRYAVLDPSIPTLRARARQVERAGVLVALGGGHHVHRWGGAIAGAIHDRRPEIDVRIVSGFARPAQASADAHLRWVAAPDGLATELGRAAVAVVAGGVTMYEAAALATPIVGLAVVPAQLEAIRAFAGRGAAIDAGLASNPHACSEVADAVLDLLNNRTLARHTAQCGASLVDGRGAFRVADAIRRLAYSGQGPIPAVEEEIHAA